MNRFGVTPDYFGPFHFYLKPFHTGKVTFRNHSWTVSDNCGLIQSLSICPIVFSFFFALRDRIRPLIHHPQGSSPPPPPSLLVLLPDPDHSGSLLHQVFTTFSAFRINYKKNTKIVYYRHKCNYASRSALNVIKSSIGREGRRMIKNINTIYGSVGSGI